MSKINKNNSIVQNAFYARERERGQWAVYYMSPQSFMIMFSYSLAKQLWGL